MRPLRETGHELIQVRDGLVDLTAESAKRAKQLIAVGPQVDILD
jgi:hypothetical protein